MSAAFQYAGRIDEHVVVSFTQGRNLDVAAEKLRGAVYKYLRSRAGHHGRHAADIAHDALVKAFGHRARFNGGSNVRMFMAWLSRNATWAAQDYFRNYFKRPDRFAFTPDLIRFCIDNTLLPEERFVLFGMLEVIEAEVFGPPSALSPREQDVLRLVAWDDQPLADAGTALGLDSKGVENALCRARKKLRDKLEVVGWLEAGERIIKDRLTYTFEPNSGQRRAKPHSNDTEE